MSVVFFKSQSNHLFLNILSKLASDIAGVLKISVLSPELFSVSVLPVSLLVSSCFLQVAVSILFCWCSFISPSVCSRPNPRNVQISVLLQRKHSANTLRSAYDRNTGLCWNTYSENRTAIDPLPERNHCISWVVRMRESSLWQGSRILFQNSNLNSSTSGPWGILCLCNGSCQFPAQSPGQQREEERGWGIEREGNGVQNRYQWIRNSRHWGVLCW